MDGNDFVFLSPKKSRITTKLFYKMMRQYYKKQFKADIDSTIMVISSRRGLNKTAETGDVIVNRNISYLLSGLEYQFIYTELEKQNTRGFFERTDLFVETLIHYTDIIPKLGSLISLFFMMISILFLIYSFSAYFIIGTIEGWASTNTFLAFSFSGIFLMLSLLSKYMLSILHLSKRTKQYAFKSVTKK